MEVPQPTRTLHRSLSPVGVVMLAYSALTPAASVYIYGADVLHMAGTGAATAFLLGGLIAGVLTYLYAELGAAFPLAGGVYPALAAILGPMAAFPYIAMMTFVAPVVLAFSVLGFANYVRVLVPSLSQVPVAIACLAAATLLALLRIRTGALITGLFLSLEFAALIILTTVALLHPVRSLATAVAHPLALVHGVVKPLPLPMLTLAIVSAVYTSGGALWATYFGEEMKDAARRIGPVIAFVGITSALMIAGPLILVALSAGDLKSILSAEAPIAAFLQQAAGPRIAALVSAGVAVAVFNAVVATVLGYSRLLYAMGRDGIWPGPISRVLGHLHDGFRSPMAASLVLAIAAAAVMALGERTLLILGASENILEYGLISVAVLVGRRLARTGATYRAPLHPLIPILGLLSAAAFVVADWIDPDAGRPTLLVLAALVIASLVYYWFRLRKTSAKWRIGAETSAHAEA
jgi:amino acid transporter